MESSYVDTILLEANRKSSPEYLASFAGNASNPSSWSNSVGSGIKLGIGDKISIHSAYISEMNHLLLRLKGNKPRTILVWDKVIYQNKMF